MGRKTLPCLRINHAIVCFGTFVMSMRSDTTSEKCSARVTGRSSIMYMIIGHIFTHLALYFSYEFLPFSFFFYAINNFTFYCCHYFIMVMIWIWRFHGIFLRSVVVSCSILIVIFFFVKISKFQTHKIRLVLQNVEPSCLSIVAVVDLKLRLRKLVIVFECRIHSICTIKPTYTLKRWGIFQKTRQIIIFVASFFTNCCGFS